MLQTNIVTKSSSVHFLQHLFETLPWFWIIKDADIFTESMWTVSVSANHTHRWSYQYRQFKTLMETSHPSIHFLFRSSSGVLQPNVFVAFYSLDQALRKRQHWGHQQTLSHFNCEKLYSVRQFHSQTIGHKHILQCEDPKGKWAVLFCEGKTATQAAEYASVCNTPWGLILYDPKN